jgi:hypothetical protein
MSVDREDLGSLSVVKVALDHAAHKVNVIYPKSLQLCNKSAIVYLSV